MFDLHILEHSFDDQVNIFQIFEIGCDGQLVFDHIGQLCLFHATCFDGIGKRIADRRNTFFNSRIVDIPQIGLITGFEQQVDDSASHNTATEHGNLFYLSRLNAFDTRKPPG